MISLLPTKPLVLKGATLGWPAESRWNWDFFASMREERLELSDHAGSPSLEATVSDYVRALKDGGNSPMARLCASGWRFFEKHPAMLGDFSEPPARCPALLTQTVRRTINSLILPIAFVGLRPFGHTSTQFMIVWQRNRRYGSSRLSRRSPVAWSRLSAMKR